MKDNLKIIIPIGAAIILLGVAGYFIFKLQGELKEEKDNNEKYQLLAEMDKKEMENEYAQFALQYDEMKRSIKNDSLLTRLNEEQARANNLLAELKKTKADDAAEIARLKKELATVREVLRSYILQVDSLNRLNQTLRDENQTLSAQYNTATSQISTLTEEKQSLSKTVAIAARIDATGVSLQALNKKGKAAKKTKDITRFVATCHISRNVTAKTGERKIYARILKPTNEVVSQVGSASFEGTTVGYSALRSIEYNGEETPVTIYVNVQEMLSPGTYRLFLFADGHTIGSASLNMSK